MLLSLLFTVPAIQCRHVLGIVFIVGIIVYSAGRTSKAAAEAELSGKLQICQSMS